MLRLYNMSASGNCYKVRLLLAHLGRPYERVPVEPWPAEKPAALRARNPAARAPTLVREDGSALPESGAILWWLAEGTAWLPDGADARAEVLRWMFFEQNMVEPNVATRRFWVHVHGDTAPVAGCLDRWLAAGTEALATLDAHLADRAFAAADRPTIADLALYGYVHAAPDGGFDLEPLPALRAWLARVAALPGHVPMDA